MRPVDGARGSAAASAQVDDGDVHFTFLMTTTFVGRVVVRAENLLHKIVLRYATVAAVLYSSSAAHIYTLAYYISFVNSPTYPSARFPRTDLGKRAGKEIRRLYLVHTSRS